MYIPLYEIDARLAEAFDEETGELLISEEEVDAIFKAEAEGIEHFIKVYKNEMAMREALMSEVTRLKERADKHKRLAEKALSIIDKHQNGASFESAVGKISYRKSTKTECLDEMAFLSWDDRWKYGKSEFTPSKSDISDAIKAGIEIPGWSRVDYNNISIK